MKTIEEIEREYEGFNPTSTFLTNLESLKSYLDVGICDTYDIEKDLKKELRENYKTILIIEIWNFLFFLISEEEPFFFQDDNEIVKQMRELVVTYRSYCERIKENATEETVKDFIKLIDFMTKYYNEHIEYFESQRDSLELAYKGIRMFNSKYSDNRETVDSFFNKKIEEISNKEEKNGSVGKIYVKKVGKNENIRTTIQRI